MISTLHVVPIQSVINQKPGGVGVGVGVLVVVGVTVDVTAGVAEAVCGRRREDARRDRPDDRSGDDRERRADARARGR